MDSTRFIGGAHHEVVELDGHVQHSLWPSLCAGLDVDKNRFDIGKYQSKRPPETICRAWASERVLSSMWCQQQRLHGAGSQRLHCLGSTWCWRYSAPACCCTRGAHGGCEYNGRRTSTWVSPSAVPCSGRSSSSSSRSARLSAFPSINPQCFWRRTGMT